MNDKTLYYIQPTALIGILCIVASTLYTKENNEHEKGPKIMNITKAVIPAAGIGTRCLPFSKAVPKEMIPLLDKPAIQYIVEEGIASGIHEFCIIANDDKKAIHNYFSHNNKLEVFLEEKGLLHLIQSVDDIINVAQFKYIPQPEPRGLGHAILMARDVIGDEYFGVFLPDEIMDSKMPVMGQLVSIAQQFNANVIGVQEVPKEHVSSYGIIGIKQQIGKNLYEISQLIEKPAVDQAPSNLAMIGRYILSPQLFDVLAVTKPGAKGEIQLTDAIAHMLLQGEKVLAYKVQANRFDIGNIPGWLQANYHFARNNPRYTAYMK